jgi:hypothetical protein
MLFLTLQPSADETNPMSVIPMTANSHQQFPPIRTNPLDCLHSYFQ